MPLQSTDNMTFNPSSASFGDYLIVASGIWIIFFAMVISSLLIHRSQAEQGDEEAMELNTYDYEPLPTYEAAVGDSTLQAFCWPSLAAGADCRCPCEVCRKTWRLDMTKWRAAL